MKKNYFIEEIKKKLRNKQEAQNNLYGFNLHLYSYNYCNFYSKIKHFYSKINCRNQKLKVNN